MEPAGESIPPRREIPHYHGGETRVIFVISALVLIVAQSTGAIIPLSPFMAVLAAVALVIAAGVTNPNHSGIHWANAFLSVMGTLLFGTAAINNYRAGVSFIESSFIYVEALALLSLLALYFTTRTIRGIKQRSEL